MSFLNLTNGAIYTFVKTGNGPNIALQLSDNDRVTVVGQPFSAGQELQQWRATGSPYTFFQNVHSNVYLTYTSNSDRIYCLPTNSSDVHAWLIYKPFNNSDSQVGLYSSMPAHPNVNSSAYLVDSQCLTTCDIKMGPKNDVSHLWNIRSVVRGYCTLRLSTIIVSFQPA